MEPKLRIVSPEKELRSPEEELDFLRAEVARREEELRQKNESPVREEVIKERVGAYKEKPAEGVLHQKYTLTKGEEEQISLGLAPEEHDSQMAKLADLLKEKGVKNTLSVIARMQNPHLADDFERFLVQYIQAGFPAKGLKKSNPLFKGLSMTLYEVSLPEHAEEGREKQLKELISAMEQFYAGMLSVADKDSDKAQYFTIELAVENHSDEFVFYAAVPNGKNNLFEKQILSLFHDARIREHKDDYNIFNETGAAVASVAVAERNPIFPLKTYEQFDHDPLHVLLNSFSKIDKDGEGAAIQVFVRPRGGNYTKKYKHALDLLNKGVKLKEAIDVPAGLRGSFFRSVKDFFKTHEKQKGEKSTEKEHETPLDTLAVEAIQAKIESPIAETNIRIVASSHTEEGAREILSHVESAFNQLENTHGNKLRFERSRGRRLEKLLRDFTFRLFGEDKKIPLNLKELATILHFPVAAMKSSPQLKVAPAGAAAAPIDLPHIGVLLGVNRYRTMETEVRLAPDDRLRHFYVIGQTGTGKTTLLKNIIVQDIKNGEGVCMIDPHGSDVQDVLSSVPKSRYEDVVYFDPSHIERPMGLNMLEIDRRYPEQKTFVVNEMLSIFNKLFDMKATGGPMFEQYFRNATMLTIEDPETGNTLLDVSRVLASKSFRELKLSRCKNPLVVQFWKEVAEKAGGEASLQNMVPYITSKFDNFLSNEIMRPIIAQETSTFNFREIMDSRKILLVNLAKGRLGDINSYLIGLIIVGKILMAALSRVDSLGKNLPPFYLYIDEFQNVTTDSIVTILSEARKYKLALIVAHQFIGQLEEKIRNAVFGNAGSLAAFRVGPEDAEMLQKQLEPVFTAKDLINLDNRHAYVRLLANGRPVKPFSIETLSPPPGNPAIVEKLKELSYLKFGRDRAGVEAEIIKKFERKAT